MSDNQFKTLQDSMEGTAEILNDQAIAFKKAAEACNGITEQSSIEDMYKAIRLTNLATSTEMNKVFVDLAVIMSHNLMKLQPELQVMIMLEIMSLNPNKKGQ